MKSDNLRTKMWNKNSLLSLHISRRHLLALGITPRLEAEICPSILLTSLLIFLLLYLSMFGFYLCNAVFFLYLFLCLTSISVAIFYLYICSYVFSLICISVLSLSRWICFLNLSESLFYSYLCIYFLNNTLSTFSLCLLKSLFLFFSLPIPIFISILNCCFYFCIYWLPYFVLLYLSLLPLSNLLHLSLSLQHKQLLLGRLTI